MSGLWSVRKLGVKQGNLTLGFLFFLVWQYLQLSRQDGISEV
jgi:hypothetical protein